eukprot:9075772-Pyramimonas_sp.AAC.1
MGWWGYAKRKEFLIDAKRLNLPSHAVLLRDTAVASFLSDMCYVRRLGHARGSLLFSGFMRFFEDHENFLSLPTRALKASERHQQGQEGQPIPPQALELSVLDLCQAGRVLEARAVVVQLGGWLREQDWAQIRKCDISVGSSWTGSSDVGELHCFWEA